MVRKIYFCKNIGCESKHVCFKVALVELQTPANYGKFLEISIAGRKCMCVSGRLALWSGHFDIRFLVPMSYLELWNYIYCPSRCQREAPGHDGRPRETREASSRAQNSAQQRKFSPPTPPGPLKLRLLGEIYVYILIHM